MSWLQLTMQSTSAAEWLSSAAAAVATAVVLLLARRVVVQRLSAFAKKTATPIDDVVADAAIATKRLFLLIFAIYAGLQFVELPPRVDHISDNVVIAVASIQVAMWMNRGILA